METMLKAVDRLRADGYLLDFSAISGGRLRCSDCGELIDAKDIVVKETVRFEGDSNPDDEAILIAVITPCGHRGLFRAAYGPTSTPNDVDVLHALPNGDGTR